MTAYFWMHSPSTLLFISAKALIHHSVNSSWRGPLLKTFKTCCSSFEALLFTFFCECFTGALFTALEDTLFEIADGFTGELFWDDRSSQNPPAKK